MFLWLYLHNSFFVRKAKTEASGEHVSQNLTLSSQIVRAQVLAENTSLNFNVPAEVTLRYRGRHPQPLYFLS